MVTARRGAAAAAAGAVIAGVVMFAIGEGRRRVTPVAPAEAPSTSRADLERTVAAMEARLSEDPADREASVALADGLLRQSRVTGNAALAVRAEEVARAALKRSPAD